MAESSFVVAASNGEWTPQDAWMRELVDERLSQLYSSLPSIEARTEWNLCHQEMVALLFVFNAVRIGITPNLLDANPVPLVNSSIALNHLLEANYQRYRRYAEGKDTEYQLTVKRGLDALGGVPERNRRFRNQLFLELSPTLRAQVMKKVLARTQTGKRRKANPPSNRKCSRKEDDYSYVKRTASRLAIVITSLEQGGWEVPDGPFSWGVLRDLLYLPRRVSTQEYEEIVVRLMAWWKGWFSQDSNERPGSATGEQYSGQEAVPLSRIAKFAEAWYHVVSFVTWRNIGVRRTGTTVRCARKLALGQPWPKQVDIMVPEKWVRDYVFDLTGVTRTDKVTEAAKLTAEEEEFVASITGGRSVVAAVEEGDISVAAVVGDDLPVAVVVEDCTLVAAIAEGEVPVATAVGPISRFRPSLNDKVNSMLEQLARDWSDSDLMELMRCMETGTSGSGYSFPRLPGSTNQ